jgi:Rieske Fe-S protein
MLRKGLIVGLPLLLAGGCFATIVVAATSDTNIATPAPTITVTTTATAMATVTATATATVRTTAKPTPAPTKTVRVTVTKKAKPAPTKTVTITARPEARRKQSTSPDLDPRFDTCYEAKAAGYGHYREGEDPEYYWYDDRDRDGVVCE